MRIASILCFNGVHVIPSPCEGWNNAGIATSAFQTAKPGPSSDVIIHLCHRSVEGQASRDGFGTVSLLPTDGNCNAYTSPNAVQSILQLYFHKEQGKWSVLHLHVNETKY